MAVNFRRIIMNVQKRFIEVKEMVTCLSGVYGRSEDFPTPGHFVRRQLHLLCRVFFP